MQQWFIAFILACVTFFIINSIQKDHSEKDHSEKDKNIKKSSNNSVILFFFIVIIFQVLFYYFDFAAIFTGSGNKKPIDTDANLLTSDGSYSGEDFDSEVDVPKELLRLNKGQQEILEKELLRSIHQDIHVGYPDF